MVNGKFIEDWNKKDILYAKSRGGVFVVSNPLDNLVYPDYIK